MSGQSQSARSPLVVAHRGASASHRENTLEAFRAAREMGADMVELDVRSSRDGALVVHHDAAIPGVGAVGELLVSEMPPDVPLLDAAVDACEGMGVNIEVKYVPVEPDFDPTEMVAAAVARFVGEHGLYERVVVSSFSLSAINEVRAVDADVRTGWLTLVGYDQLSAISTAADHGHGALHPEHGAATTSVVAAAHQAGLAVSAWTVDDPERMAELAAAGVDSIITNVPDVAVAALARLPPR